MGRDWTLHRILLITMVQLATLIFGMTVTVVSIVMPQMQGTLSATQDQIAWTITFNLVATAIATPLTGWLAARLGWRKLMVGSIGGFTLATVFCGLSTSLEMLVIFRILQGAFGAPLLPLGQGILLASFPRHMHPLVLMLWGIGGVVGPVFGPIFGGMIAEAFNWRWAFYFIVPFGCLAMVGAWIALDDAQQGAKRRIDWIGFLRRAGASGAATLLLNRGQRLDWFDSQEIVIETFVAAIGFYLFIVHTITADSPFFDRAIFLNRNLAVGLFIALIMGMLAYTPLVMFPPLLKDLGGYPESIIGELMTSRGIGNWLSFLVVVQMTRYDARLCLALGLVLQAVAGLLMAQFDLNISPFDVFWTNVLHGFGFGLAYTPLATLAFSTLREQLMVEGSAIFNVMRHFGSVFFISLSILVLTRTTEVSYSGLRNWVSPFNELFGFIEITGPWSVTTAAGLAALSEEAYRQAAMVGYINAFYLFAATAAVTVPFVWLFKPAAPEQEEAG